MGHRADIEGGLLERAAALDALGGFLADARAGRGRLVFLHGEAGIGKSALLRRLRELHGGSARVLWGGCDAALTPRALGPLVDVAEQAGGELAALVGRAAPLHEIADALTGELRGGTATVLVLEDVHWADEATLDLLRVLARRVDALPALVVASLRDDELDRAHPLRIALGELATAPAVERMALMPLSLAAVRTLAAPYGADEAELHRKTGGNPFFVTEVLGARAAKIPDSVRDAVLARAARLSPAARGVLEAVAIVPSKVELWLLGALTDGALEPLDECLVSGMLRDEDGAVAFRHELARRAIEETTPPHRRLDLHRRALAALAAAPAGAAVDPARPAYHADAAGDVDAALHWAPIAGARAAAVGAHVEAAAHFGVALRFAAGLPLAQQARLYERRSLECYLTDQLDEALAAADQALALHRTLGNRVQEGDSLRMVSRLLWFVGRVGEAEAAGREAVTLLESEPAGPELAMAYSNLAHLAMLAQKRPEAIAWGSAAVVLAERLGEPLILAHALNNLGTAQFQTGSPDGKAKLERSLAVARAAGSEEHVARALGNLASTALDVRSYATAKRYTEEAIEYTRERDLGPKLDYLVALRARCDLEQGRWRAAADAAELVLRQPGTVVQARVMALVVLGRLRARTGDGDVWEPLDEALSLAPSEDLRQAGAVAAARAEAAWLAGDREAVRASTEAAFALACERGDSWLAGELAQWRAAAGIGDEAPVPAAEPFALQLAGESARAAALWEEIGCPYEAALALAGGDEDAMQRALDELQRLGARPAAQAVARRLRERGVRRVARGPRAVTRSNHAGLTPRQLEVLGLVAAGLQNAEIAERLVLSPKTVEHHVSAILGKLSVRSRRDARAVAVRLGVVADA